MIKSKYILSYWVDKTEIIVPMNFNKSSLKEITIRLVKEAKEALDRGDKLFRLNNSDFPFMNSENIADGLFYIHPIEDKVKNYDKYISILEKEKENRQQKNKEKEIVKKEEEENYEVFCIYDKKNKKYLGLEDTNIMFTSIQEAKVFLQKMVDTAKDNDVMNLSEVMNGWEIFVMKRTATIELIKNGI